MSLDADLIVDRRRMRRKLTFWRVLAVLVVIGAVVAVATMARRSTMLTAGGDYIARVKITGLIRNDQDRVASLACCATRFDAARNPVSVSFATIAAPSCAPLTMTIPGAIFGAILAGDSRCRSMPT